MRAVQGILTHWKFYLNNFVGCTMPKTSTRRKGKTNQVARIRKTKVNAKGKHVETLEEAAASSA